jgi:hypothetical protein
VHGCAFTYRLDVERRGLAGVCQFDQAHHSKQHSPSVMVVPVNVEHLLALHTENTVER